MIDRRDFVRLAEGYVARINRNEKLEEFLRGYTMSLTDLTDPMTLAVEDVLDNFHPKAVDILINFVYDGELYVIPDDNIAQSFVFSDFAELYEFLKGESENETNECE